MQRHDPKLVRRARILARLGGAAVGLVGGVLYATWIIANSSGVFDGSRRSAALALMVMGLVGLASGALAGPILSVEPFLWLEDTLDTAETGALLGGTVGLVVALVVSALLAVLLGGLPYGLGLMISLPLACALVFIGVRVGLRRRVDVAALVDHVNPRVPGGAAFTADIAGPAPHDGPPVVVDTSVLVDGRILDVARTGFVPGRLVIPSFVLEELQRLADAGDAARRGKGRRGLHVVEELKASADIVCEIVEVDFPGAPEVDAKLIKLARVRAATLMTTDYNLNRLAQIESIRVLNVNQLANAVKPIVSSGETMQVTILKEGKEPLQGVAYLPDGTMIVVEGGRRHIEQTISVTVTSVLQTPAGRMIFATAAAPAAAGTGVGGEQVGQAAPDEGRTRGSRGRAPRAAHR